MIAAGRRIAPSPLTGLSIDIPDGMDEFSTDGLMLRFEPNDVRSNHQLSDEALNLELAQAIVDVHGGNLYIKSRYPLI